ncbi:MAG: T9SS type A sorting domain-containing protein [Flavobacteriales bacterium]|nr:T9SS type A sorting domain-containing protein [Flavobacteriales bacterium]
MNPTRAVHAALVFVLATLFTTVRAQQGLNNLWMGGTNSEAPMPFGGTDLDFYSGSVVLSYVNRDIDFRRTSANITDAEGNLLFSTNGAYIANATGDTMLNGTGLNPSNYTSLFPEGLYISQACLILAKPDAPDIYYLFHGTIDDQAISVAQYLYLTTIDMNLDGGWGGVVTKNHVLISDVLNEGRITAIRHANGRDWWVFCHKAYTNTFYRLIVTPDGVSLDGTQSIGIVRPPDHGQACFSPDGTRFAYYWGDGEDLEIFDFDRCTGLFSNPVHILIDDYDQMGGVAFSPNSRYLYVSSVEDVYQYDTEAPDIEASMVHIAHWDGFYSPGPPFATLFDIAQLAPDGKVYIATGNSTLHLHVIHDPDEPGMACNMVQHDLELPTYYSNSLPNHPNYHLGPVVGSVCDSLALTASSTLTPGEGPGVRVYPNPSNGQFNLSYPVQPEAGMLEVLDVRGRVVYQSRLAAWSQVHRVALGGEAAGMYQCRVSWGTKQATIRLILEP